MCAKGVRDEGRGTRGAAPSENEWSKAGMVERKRVGARAGVCVWGGRGLQLSTFTPSFTACTTLPSHSPQSCSWTEWKG